MHHVGIQFRQRRLDPLRPFQQGACPGHRVGRDRQSVVAMLERDHMHFVPGRQQIGRQPERPLFQPARQRIEMIEHQRDFHVFPQWHAKGIVSGSGCWAAATTA